jgi:hypothetical protein
VNIESFLTGVLGAVIGTLATLIADEVRRRRSAEANRRRRREERSEQVAERLVTVLDDVRHHFQSFRGPRSWDVLGQFEKDLRSRQVLLTSPELRSILDDFIFVLRDGVNHRRRDDLDFYFDVGRMAREVQDAVAAMLRSEPLPSCELLSRHRDSLKAAIDQMVEAWEAGEFDPEEGNESSPA